MTYSETRPIIIIKMKNLSKVGAVCLLAFITPSVNAFFGLGGCPANVP
jgi:hypothetical protein